MDKPERPDAPATLGAMLRDGALNYSAPDGLRERIRNGLAKTQAEASGDARPAAAPEAPTTGPTTTSTGKPKSRGGRPSWWQGTLAPWFFGGAGGAVLGGLAVAVALLVVRPPVPDSLTSAMPQEIVASHVRALLSQRAVDVVSTDQHTVKPWFNGRIDYAPPVVDLATRGFPLVGGRTDYVDHRTVAVMIYLTDKHPIDLYVYPAADKSTQMPTFLSEDGYAIARWQHDGMTYWAITDAEMAHLRVFAQAVLAAT